jgi:hypothetical protein
MGSFSTYPIQAVFRKKIKRLDNKFKPFLTESTLTNTTLEATWVYCTRHGYFKVHHSAFYEPTYRACPLCTPERTR